MENIQQQVAARLEQYRAQRSQFISLIKEQEVLAARDPEAYKSKVVRFAMLGYFYIFGVVVLLVLLLAAMVYALIATRASAIILKLGILIVPVLYYVVKSLVVKIDKPTGPSLSRADAPELWKDVDELAKMLGAPKIGEIIIEMDMNAAAAQVPRLGIFGWYRNCLLLGLPLMIMLPPEEMKSVIAHEFGHFSGQHGRVGGWIYRLNTTFERIRQSLDSGSGSFLFGKFFAWYQPRFDAVSFALRRQNEYAADAAAAQTVGAKVAARALMRLSYLGTVMNRGVWDPITERSKNDSEAPKDVYDGVEARLVDELENVPFEELLRRDLENKTDYEDTHPSLTDRLKSLGELPGEDLEAIAGEFATPPAVSAADHYLGAAKEKVIAQFNREFYDYWAPHWAEIHQEHVADLERLVQLEEKQGKEPLSLSEQIDLGFLTLRKKDAELAVPIFEGAHAQHPDDPEVQFGLGEALLEVGDPSGESYLRRSFQTRVEYLSSAARLIAAFHAKQGRMSAIDDLREEYLERAQSAQIIEQEMSNLRITDEYQPARFDETQRQHLREQLSKRNDIIRAWLVTKVVQAEVEHSTQVLVLEVGKSILSSTERNQQVVNSVLETCTFPMPIVVFAPDGIKPWVRRFADVPNSLLFER